MEEKSVSLLRRLTEAHGAPGSEAAVRRIFADELGPDGLGCDRVGSILCELPGQAPAPRVMLECHMDEVGFAVRLITAEGFLRFTTLGGWWGHTLLAQRVRILTRDGNEVLGLITSKPPHFLSDDERTKVIKPDAMFIDIGAAAAAEVAALGIRLGDPIVPDSAFTRMANPDLLMCKAFDNRVGVGVAIRAAQALRGVPRANTIVAVGSAQEEVGARGAQASSAAARPDVAIVLEGTPADDAPGSPPSESQGALHKGPQIRLMDPTALMNRPLVDWVTDLAAELEIPHQVAVRTSGGTDASRILLHELGVPTVVIGVPARYIHTHNAIISLADFEHTLQLVTEIGRRLDAKTVQSFTQFI